jgi:hypothetical protein
MPPTIAKKKRESERKVPLRKRTAMVDMRMVRGKISAGAPTRELYAAAQKAGAPVPPVPSVPRVPAAQPQPIAAPVKPKSPLEAPRPETLNPPPAPTPAVPAPPTVHDSNDPPHPTFKEPPPETDDLPSPAASVVPAPSAVSSDEPQHPTFKEPPPEDDDLPRPTAPVVSAPPALNLDEPQRPSFKEPPPEEDDIPPHPSFKEPPPEDDYTPLPMPKFTDPPESPPTTPQPQSVVPSTVPTHQIKPVPVKRDSLINRSNSPSPGTPSFRSRSPSPADEPQTSLSRSPSNQAGYVRGPRTSRGPRAPGGSNVSSMVSSLNRHSMTGSPPPSSGYKRLSPGSSSRPQSMIGAVAQDTRAKAIGRTQALSRRTMASDAEDEVVQ